MSMKMHSDIPRETCLLCGAAGNILHENLEDLLFGVAGHWRMRRCQERDCGLAWIDPLPSEERLNAAYSGYHTHHLPARPNIMRKAMRATYRSLQRFTPFLESSVPLESMFLNGISPGRLLDVGCGSGTFLSQMSKSGWSVEGLETDAAAARIARELSGIPVKMGTIECAGYPAESFDAVTLSHVIEHVADPVAVLRECWRVLRSGGAITVTTPNLESLAHTHFHSCWRGLEPPRHLQVFSMASLRKCAVDAGIPKPRLSTSAGRASGLYLGSLLLSKIASRKPSVGNSAADYARAVFFAFRESRLLASRPEVGEEVVLRATK